MSSIKTRFTSLVMAIALSLPGTAFAQSETEQPLQVAVVDSGVERSEFLAPMMGLSYDMRAQSKGRDARSGSLHGTYVASIIAARVDRPITIHSFRVDVECRRNDPCRLDSGAISAAVSTATRMGVDLIQISIDGRLGDTAIDAIARAAEAGVQVVLSAGNDGLRSETADAASGLGPNVHVVGSTDEHGNRSDFTSYSRKKDVVLVMRQGENVDTFGADSKPAQVTGTSFAAPIYAAELLQAMPRTALVQTAAR